MEKKEIGKKTQLKLNFDLNDQCSTSSDSIKSNIQVHSNNSFKVIELDYRKEIYKRILQR